MSLISTAYAVKPQASPVRGGRAAWVELIRDGDVLRQRLSRMAGPVACSIFQSADVLTSWIETIGASARARGEADWFAAVVSAEDAGVPWLVFPFVRRREGPFWIIEAADLGIADFNGPLIARGFTPTHADMALIWRDVVAALPRADVLRLLKLPEAIGLRPNPMLGLPNVHKMGLQHLKARLQGRSGTWSVADLPEPTRELITIRRRKLAKRGRLAFATASTAAEADRIFAVMLAHRAERCRDLGRINILDDAATRDFYRRLVRPGAQGSVGVLQALTLDDDIIATGYGLVGDGAFHMIFPTFQAAGLRNYSPGLQLFAASMEWAQARGLTHYDFTIGAEAFKRDLGAEALPLFELLTPLSVRGRAFVYAEGLKRTVKRHPRLSQAVRRLQSSKSLSRVYSMLQS